MRFLGLFRQRPEAETAPMPRVAEMAMLRAVGAVGEASVIARHHLEPDLWMQTGCRDSLVIVAELDIVLRDALHDIVDLYLQVGGEQ